MQEIKEGRENARIYGEPRIKFCEKKGERWERYEERQDDRTGNKKEEERERGEFGNDEYGREREVMMESMNLEEGKRGN